MAQFSSAATCSPLTTGLLRSIPAIYTTAIAGITRLLTEPCSARAGVTAGVTEQTISLVAAYQTWATYAGQGMPPRRRLCEVRLWRPMGPPGKRDNVVGHPWPRG